MRGLKRADSILEGSCKQSGELQPPSFTPMIVNSMKYSMCKQSARHILLVVKIADIFPLSS